MKKEKHNLNEWPFNKRPKFSYTDWENAFMRFAHNTISEIESDITNNLNLKIILDSNYPFGNKQWLAVYEKSKNAIRQGKIIIGINLSLMYKKMKELNIDNDFFNIEAQARITIGHEIAHGIIDYIRMNNLNQQIVQMNSVDEENMAEEFGEYLFPEATDRYDSELADIIKNAPY